jgi:alkylation response protein AidB-like acyl-CoA dehydrogenase
MRLEPSLEQVAVGDTVRDYLEKRVPIPTLRQQLASPSSTAKIPDNVWREMCDLGWFALGLPEAHGGAGLGLSEEAALFRELGRHATPGSFVATTIGGRIAAAAGDENLREAICEGGVMVGLSVGEWLADATPGNLTLSLSANGATLHRVLEIETVGSLDPFVHLSRATVSAPICVSSNPLVISRARVLVAAQLLGVIEGARDMSSQYAVVRTQFGVPIGTFQAVKHRCADMAIAAYSCTAQTFAAAQVVEKEAVDAPVQAAAAFILAARGAQRSTADNIQNHGAIGFTWEHDAHLYLKRARTLALMCGGVNGSVDVILNETRHLL